MADKQLSAIEAEMEEARARLSSTIDQLAYRASPKTIAKREVNAVKGYFVDADGAPRTINIAKVAGAVAGVAVLFTVVRKLTR